MTLALVMPGESGQIQSPVPVPELGDRLCSRYHDIRKRYAFTYHGAIVLSGATHVQRSYAHVWTPIRARITLRGMNEETAKDLVDRLIESGMGQTEIAQALTEAGVSVTQPTIFRIKNGATTSFEIGRALLRLAHSRCKPGKRESAAQSA